MNLESVSATSRTAALRPAARVPHDQAQPDPGTLLRLLLGRNAGGQQFAHGEEGQVYRLGHGHGAPPWREGQTVLVQVLRTGPPLEVRVLGMLVADGGGNGTGLADVELPALRPDQAAILRLAVASTDTMVHAAHWRQLVLAALRQAATLAPAHSAMAAPEGSAAPPLDDAALMLRVLPWHGWPLTLWLEQRRWAGGPNRRSRRRAGTRLCLSVTLPHLGMVALMLDVLDVQVGLTLTVADAAAVAPLRAQVSGIAARMARAGLRLMRCHVRHDPQLAPPTSAATGTPAVGTHELPLALFRAGAEALEALHRRPWGQPK